MPAPPLLRNRGAENYRNPLGAPVPEGNGGAAERSEAEGVEELVFLSQCGRVGKLSTPSDRLTAAGSPFQVEPLAALFFQTMKDIINRPTAVD